MRRFALFTLLTLKAHIDIITQVQLNLLNTLRQSFLSKPANTEHKPRANFRKPFPAQPSYRHHLVVSLSTLRRATWPRSPLPR